MIIRRSILSINEANKGKLETLEVLAEEMVRVINLFIDKLWESKKFSGKYVSLKTDTWLSARLQQALSKQALEIVKSQRKRKKKTKPVFKRKAFNLDGRFVDFRHGEGHFDIWVRLSSLGNRLQLRLPAKAHKHYNKFSGWARSNSIRLIKRHGKWFIEVFFKKREPSLRKEGKVIGIDCGYKDLVVTSDRQVLGKEFNKVYEKIARKKQGSKAFKRALIERDNLINRELNKLNLTNVKEVIVENLKRAKHKTKGKFRRSFNNKLQRWSYSKVLRKLHHMTEEAGILLTKVNPAYTSQKCCKCGVIDKANRKGKLYQCTCGNVMDADLNAARNISHMGVYSPHAVQA